MDNVLTWTLIILLLLLDQRFRKKGYRHPVLSALFTAIAISILLMIFRSIYIALD